MHAIGYSFGAAALFCAGWQGLLFARCKRAPARSRGAIELDAESAAVLRTIAERGPVDGAELPATSQQLLDRLSAMGLLKCEFTAAAGEEQGRTFWSVFPEFRERALGAPEKS